jgi:bifunctional DNase/RNase
LEVSLKKILLEVIGLSYSQTQTGAYALVLGESEGNRRLPIIIGGFEAQAIAIELEKMAPSRPLTHDLFKKFAEAFKVTVKEVIIYNLLEGIFYAKLICDDGTGNEVEIDSRTSDAIALAVRFSCPVYTYEFILSSAGIVLDEENKTDEELEEVTKVESSATASSDLGAVSVQELETLLDQAISSEEYEKASKIRDEIKRRKSQ